MAHMYPPDGPSAQTTSSAEIKVYNALATLDDAYHVIHHTQWVTKPSGRGRRGSKRQIGENDFVIIHPEKGIIVLEVKGGRVRFDGNRFFTTPLLPAANDREQETTNPFEQARQFMFALKDFLEESYTTARFIEMYKMLDAVWFPDITWTETEKIQYASQQIFDALDLRDPERALERVFAIMRQSMPVPIMSTEAQQRLIRVLVPGGKPHQTLRDLFERNRRQLNHLTDEQVDGLRNMRLLRRIAFMGGAGTGKTVLAFEIAAQLVDEGLRVLFLCFNHEQAEFLRGNNHEKPAERPPNFDIRFPIMLCKVLAEKAGLDPAQIDPLRIYNAKDRQIRARLKSGTMRGLAPPKSFGEEPA